MTIDQHLEAAIDWAEERLRSGAEPPFVYYRLMQLREAAKELSGHAKQCAANSLRPERCQENAPQQADGGHLPNIFPLHQRVRDEQTQT